MKIILPTLLFYIGSLSSLLIAQASIPQFLETLRTVEQTHISLEDAYIHDTYQKHGEQLIEAVLYEMKNTPHTWVIKESLNIAKAIAEHPKQTQSVFPIVYLALNDLDSEIRGKAMLCLRFIRERLNNRELEQVAKVLADILCNDIDEGNRRTSAKTIRMLECKNLVYALVVALQRENKSENHGDIVSALKKITGVSTIYGVDKQAWATWYNQNKLTLGSQVAPGEPIQYHYDPNTQTAFNATNPNALMLSIAKCLAVKDYRTIHHHLFSRRHTKKGNEQTPQQYDNDLNWKSLQMFHYRRYYERFFQRFAQNYQDPDMVQEKIDTEESAVEYTQDQYSPDDRFSYAKVALEFELICLFVEHGITADDRRDVQDKKKAEAEKKARELYQQAKTASSNMKTLDQFFVNWHKEAYTNKPFTPPIRQFYLLSEFEKKNRRFINDLFSGEFTPVFSTHRGYEFYYCLNSQWKLILLR